MKTIKVGQMPGRINEFAVEEGTSIIDVLNIAGLDPSGFTVKVDGNVVENLYDTFVTSTTSLILLTKMVKGN